MGIVRVDLSCLYLELTLDCISLGCIKLKKIKTKVSGRSEGKVFSSQELFFFTPQLLPGQGHPRELFFFFFYCKQIFPAC